MNLIKLWKIISNSGVSASLDKQLMRKVVLCNQIGFSIGFALFIGGTMQILSGYHQLAPPMFFMTGLYFLVVVLNYFDYHNLSRIYLNVLPPLLITFLSGLFLYQDTFFKFALIPVILVPVLLFGITEQRKMIMGIAWIVFIFLTIDFITPWLPKISEIKIDSAEASMNSTINGLISFFMFSASFIYFQRLNLHAENELTETLRKVQEQKTIIETHNAALQIEKERAETANHAKSQFLAAASHDLRQPTHAMALFVATLRALILHSELKRPEIEVIVNRLHDSLKNLGQLLTTLLDVSRLDAGVVTTDNRPIALQDALTSVTNEFAGPARAKGLELVVVPSKLWVQSDPVVLHRVLSNLVSNAVRYTHQGRILIGCRPKQRSVEVQVHDTGIGIAPEQFTKIFQEFYQVHNVVRDREQGLGLGLSIVQRLVALLDAKLHIDSTLGKGSLFALQLPRAAPQVALSRQSPLPLPAPQQARTVLVIDDDREILEAVRQLLEAWGHAAILATTLEQAMEEASRHTDTISLILSDYRLAENGNGADAIRAVFTRLARIVPAVIITGDTSPDRIREANASGFTLLHKPLDPEKLRQLINGCQD
jgi:signal transduction histidine kinase/CheY-like chemotaxis protein